MSPAPDASEGHARKYLIDPQIRAQGWEISPYAASWPLPYDREAVEEFLTDDGPADYALCVDGQVLGIVEAKRLSLGPQNVMTQAERYSKGATRNPFDFDGYHVPLLYSTKDEVIWFHDVRHQLNRSRQITSFHTPGALAELLDRDLDRELARLTEIPNQHRVVAATARVDKLSQVTLAKAFRGELVPTEAQLAQREGREYEPASVLLERIRVERIATPSLVSKRDRQDGNSGNSIRQAKVP